MPKGVKKNPVRGVDLKDRKRLQKQFTIAPKGFEGYCSKCLTFDILDDVNELCMKCWDKQTSNLTKKRFTNVRDSNI